MCSGYMAPEYAMHGQFSVKSDIFSFGVLVLEIISGQKNSSFRNGENMEDLLSYVSIFIFGSNGTYTPYGMVGLHVQILPCNSIGVEKFETIPFIFMFMMWSIKHATSWAVPIKYGTNNVLKVSNY